MVVVVKPTDAEGLVFLLAKEVTELTKLYDNIKALCKENQISILGLERKIGLPKNTISGWRLKLPSAQRVLEVAHYFDVSVDFLLGNTDNRFSHKTIKTLKTSSKELLKCSEQFDLDAKAISYITEMIATLKKYY